jgi:hypothetical protein
MFSNTALVVFQTDLKNTDYTLEAGATRLFEAEKLAKQMAEEEQKAKEAEELNPMMVCTLFFFFSQAASTYNSI